MHALGDTAAPAAPSAGPVTEPPDDEANPAADVAPRRLGWPACAFGVAPVLVLLVGFVGSTFDPTTRLVARVAAVALLVGAVASRRRAPVAVTASAVLLFVIGTIWVFALPDGRHPVVMAYVLVVAALVLAPPVLEHVRAPRPRPWLLPAVLGGLLLLVYAVAVSPLPLRAKVAAYEAAMNSDAEAALAATSPSAGDAERTHVAYGCFGGRLLDVAIGPFPVCHRTRDAGGSQLTYDLGRPVLGVGDHTTYGLVYAPTGPPGGGACTARVIGDWYEYTLPDGGGCPPGQVRAP